MDDLRELIAIVTPKKLNAARRAGLALTVRNPLVLKMYQGIADGKIQSEAEAELRLFGPKGNKRQFRKVRQDLKEYLLHLLLVVDLSQPHYHKRQKSYFECYKKWAALKILSGKNAHSAFLETAERLQKEAETFEFTDINVDIVRSLRLYFGSLVGNRKKYEHYKALADRYEEMFHFENLAEALYTDLVFAFVNSKSTKEAASAHALEGYRQIEKALEKHDSYRLHFTGRLLEILVHTSKNDYKKTVEVCDRAIRFFEAKPYIATVPLQVFLYQEMVCFVQLRNYAEGEKAARRGLQLLEEGSFNWFKYQELLVMLSLHSGQYQRAYEIFRKTVLHRRFGALPAGIKQTWKILEAYIFYLLETGRIKPVPGDTVFNRFRVARFVNEVPIFSKDKRGLNIPIIIFQIIFLIQQKRYGEVLDRMDAINRYASRYLRRDDNFRSNCFIKMLQTIPASDFHPVAVERHAAKTLKLLRSVPLDFANQSHDIEILPYEELWGLVMASIS